MRDVPDTRLALMTGGCDRRRMESSCLTSLWSGSPATGTAATRSPTPGPFQPRLRVLTVESTLRRNTQGGLGERPGEADRWQHRHRAPGRLNRGSFCRRGRADPELLTTRIGNPSLSAVESGFLAITQPQPDHDYFPHEYGLGRTATRCCASWPAAVPASPGAHEQAERNGVSTDLRHRFVIVVSTPRSEGNLISRDTNQGDRPMSDRTGPWRSSPATKTPTNGGRRYRRTKRSPFEIQRAASVALVAGGLAISGWAVLQLPDEAPSVQATTSSYAKGEKPEFLGKRVPAARCTRRKISICRRLRRLLCRPSRRLLCRPSRHLLCHSRRRHAYQFGGEGRHAGLPRSPARRRPPDHNYYGWCRRRRRLL